MSQSSTSQARAIANQFHEYGLEGPASAQKRRCLSDEFIAILWISTARKEFSAPPPSLQENCVYPQRWLALSERNEPPLLSPLSSTTKPPVMALQEAADSLSEARQRMGFGDCSGGTFAKVFGFRLLSRSMKLGCGRTSGFGTSPFSSTAS